MNNLIKQMDFWYQKPPGLWVLEQEQQLISGLLSSLAGQCLVQMSGPSNLSLVESSPIAHKYFFSLNGETTPQIPSVTVQAEQLPLRSEIVDVFVVAHALAFVDSPLAVLSEIYNCLAPGGAVIIVGFNPWSLWNISRIKYRRYFPWNGHHHSRIRVARWLSKVDFQIAFNQTFCFRFPCFNEKQWKKWSFVDSVGRLCFPGMGGMYMIMAHKKKPGMTPLIDKLWASEKIKINNGVVKPTTNEKGFL